MRYEHWDVLAFPASDMPCAPLPEYSTKCAAIHDNALRAAVSDEVGITPLLTCFLPALLPDEPFQISVHNWLAQPTFGYERTIGNGASAQVWQVRVDIDGILTAIERYPAGTVWPQIISCANQNLGIFPIQSPVPLRFPPFYHSVTQSHIWDPADETGRITVEISEGYIDNVEDQERFTKLKNYALFNFQPAPLDVLTRAGIAWPNPGMFQHPLPPRQEPVQQCGLPSFSECSPHNAVHAPNSAYGIETAHQRNLSVASTVTSHLSSPFFSSSTGMPIPPPPTPATSMTYGFNPGSICDNSSRSTSAYSTIPYSSLPMINDQLDQLSGTHAPSGQVKIMLNTVNVSNTNRTLFSEMPPPPLPQHALDAKENGIPDRRAFTWPEPRMTLRQMPVQPSVNDRRVDSHSNQSDVSMHAGCTGYPNCTSEDAEGHLVHSPPGFDQGRNDERDVGQNDDRDYMSIVLSPLVEEPNSNTVTSSNEAPTLISSSPADSSGKKRTRSSTRALLSINSNGSPEKTEKTNEATQPARKVSKVSVSFCSKEHL